MGKVQEGGRNAQLNLFDRSGPAETADCAGRRDRPRSGGYATLDATLDATGLSRDALLAALERGLDGPTDDSRDLLALIAEVGRRREAAAAQIMVRVCRRHAGFDRERAVPEVAAALKALAAARAADGAPAILRLVENGALGHASVAAALLYFASVRYRSAAKLIRACLHHDEAGLRAAACALAAALAARSETGRLSELLHDTRSEVADAALLALGGFGYRPVKKTLESRLQTAAVDDIPGIVDALAAVSDEETAVCLGRRAEGVSDDGVRCVLARALAELDGRAAAKWLLRLANDPSPAVRSLAADALAARKHPRTAAAGR